MPLAPSLDPLTFVSTFRLLNIFTNKLMNGNRIITHRNKENSNIFYSGIHPDAVSEIIETRLAEYYYRPRTSYEGR